MPQTTAPSTKRTQPKASIVTVEQNGRTQYQVVYENAVVATVDSLYLAQQTAHRIDYPVNQI